MQLTIGSLKGIQRQGYFVIVLMFTLFKQCAFQHQLRSRGLSGIIISLEEGIFEVSLSGRGEEVIVTIYQELNLFFMISSIFIYRELIDNNIGGCALVHRGVDINLEVELYRRHITEMLL